MSQQPAGISIVEEDDERVVIRLTKELDWLPPRPQFFGTRCLFQMCCTSAEAEPYDEGENDEEDKRSADPQQFLVRSLRSEGMPSISHDPHHSSGLDEIPLLEMESIGGDSSDEELSLVYPQKSQSLPATIAYQNASLLLFQVARLLLSLVMLDKAFCPEAHRLRPRRRLEGSTTASN